MIAPFLIGQAQKAYFDLDDTDAEEYPTLKQEILGRYSLSPRIRAQQFHDWIFAPSESPRAQMHELVRLVTGWLLGGQATLQEAVERLGVDRFLRALPYDMGRDPPPVVRDGNFPFEDED